MLFFSAYLIFSFRTMRKLSKESFSSRRQLQFIQNFAILLLLYILFLDLIDLVKRWVRFPNVHNSNDLKNRSAMCTCGLMLSLIPFRWSSFLNVNIWELNCYKWDGSHCKDKGVEISELCNIDFFYISSININKSLQQVGNLLQNTIYLFTLSSDNI